MHQTLGKHVTPAAAETLSNLYNKISQAYHRRPGDENFQANLDGVKKTLSETRRATQREFLCFKQSKKSSSSGSRGNSSGSSSRAGKEGSRNRKDHK
jgi:exocyst complex component 2